MTPQQIGRLIAVVAVLVLLSVALGLSPWAPIAVGVLVLLQGLWQGRLGARFVRWVEHTARRRVKDR
jgi:thiosulfate reductase cytochrome b subunit